MKNLYIYLIIILTVCILNGCGGSGTGTAIVSKDTIAIINDTIAANGGKITCDNIPAIAATIKKDAQVEDACAGENCLVVKYKDAGYHIWPMTDPVDQLPADIPAQIPALRNKRQASQSLLNNNVVIINGCAELPAYARRNSYMTKIKDNLTANGFIVQELTPNVTTPDELRILKYYTLIIHQGVTGCELPIPGLPYCVTVGKWNDVYCTLADWKANRIVKVTMPDGGGDYFAVTGKFWEDAYSTEKFSNAFFMNLASCGSHHESYRQSLYKTGVSVYSGWSAPQGKSAISAWRLLASMCAGKSLRQAINGMPDDYKTDADANRETADFWCGPDSALDITLYSTAVPTAKTVISSPANNLLTSADSCTVAGNITPFNAAGIASINVNGKSSPLTVAENGAFSRVVTLSNNINIITVNYIINGLESSSSITVNRIMNNLIFFSQLTWDSDYTDLDLHMMPVSGANDSMQECYYGNKTADWGGQLSKVVETGFGPEIINATTLLPGKYLLWAEYFNSNEQDTPTTATALITVNGKPVQTINMAINDKFIYTDDRWDICEIDMPSGEITVINKFTSDQLE